MKKLLFLFSIAVSITTQSQETYPVNGVFNKNHNYYAFTNATIVIDYQTQIEKASLLIKDGHIVNVGANVAIPNGAVVYDLKGKFIYPSFIDIYSTYGMQEVKKSPRSLSPQMETKTSGAYHWNQAIKPEIDAYKQFTLDKKATEEYRRLGFGSVLTSQKDGIARGTGAFVSLGETKENELIIEEKAAAFYSFEKGTSNQTYPSSLMGAIALLRQTYYDALWYKNDEEKKEINLSLDAFNFNQNLPQIFEVGNKLSALRADKVGDEFKVQYVIKGNGDEYQQLQEIKNTNAKFIIPINFPVLYDVEDALDADLVSLSEMKHWEMAPANLAFLEKSNVEFAVTSYGLKDKKEFWRNIRKAIEYGASEKKILQALTTTPAQILGLANKVGSLKPQMLANFIITSGNLFDEKNIIYENWIQGNRFQINDMNTIDIRANYDFKLSNDNYTLKVEGDLNKLSASLIALDTVKTPVVIRVSGNVVALSLKLKDDSGTIRLTGSINENPLKLFGKGQLTNGTWVDWTAVFKYAFLAEIKKDTSKKSLPKIGNVIYPFTAYGVKEKPTNENILIKNVTVWTNEKEGIIKNKDVYIAEKKIKMIGDNILPMSGVSVKVIDGTGKHLTAGIIDEHSHIAISDGVNESGQASTAEVRIGDVINSEDINIYRQLSGGVTSAQLLHGSANPIGGQSALIKLRWGKSPEEMKIMNADGFIKFALGENVKQSNWGDFETVRFPQSRMGVEQVYYDCFLRAKEYQNKWKGYEANKAKTLAPRRDLDLEALNEILNKKRFITCHSYVQSEVNMLMHVGDSMGFKVNTFTHILEGYKVADKMQQRQIGASTFSDWWAYKMEVNDAIPCNAALLNKMNIVTAINSDDAEMGRRLNQEAAKSIKYGVLSEEEALKLVTLNPAKLLHLDDKIGSIKVGKDADLVLWSDHPLSIYAKVEKTMIDGTIYFDSVQDIKLQDDIKSERARLIQKMILEKNGGEKTQKPTSKKQKLYHCDDMENFGAN